MSLFPNPLQVPVGSRAPSAFDPPPFDPTRVSLSELLPELGSEGPLYPAAAAAVRAGWQELPGDAEGAGGRAFHAVVPRSGGGVLIALGVVRGPDFFAPLLSRLARGALVRLAPLSDLDVIRDQLDRFLERIGRELSTPHAPLDLGLALADGERDTLQACVRGHGVLLVDAAGAGEPVVLGGRHPSGTACPRGAAPNGRAARTRREGLPAATARDLHGVRGVLAAICSGEDEERLSALLVQERGEGVGEPPGVRAARLSRRLAAAAADIAPAAILVGEFRAFGAHPAEDPSGPTGRLRHYEARVGGRPADSSIFIG